jgi:hypothetical protein
VEDLFEIECLLKDKTKDHIIMVLNEEPNQTIFEKVKYIDNILYLYNIHNPISDHMKNQQLQWDINDEINNKKKFITL